MYTSTVLNLRELPKKSHVWEQLKGLTVPGWAAYDFFCELHRHPKSKMLLTDILIKIVYDKNVPIAWGLVLNEATSTQLWLYTKPQYRQQGIQKNIILKYWNKKQYTYHVYSYSGRQKSTFKYLKNKST